jgi:hypothetical protein
MTKYNDLHAPSDVFRANLERRVRDELRVNTSGPAASRRRMTIFRQAALLAIGVLLGVGTQVASAQVQEARKRSELETARELDLRVAAMRLQVAADEHARVRKAFEAGALSQQSLLSAATELRAMQLAITRINLDLAEIRLTSVAPRNELWAPIIDTRDFVKERIKLDVAAAQGRLTAAQSAFADAERQVRVGAALPSASQAAREEMARADRDIKVHASRLSLRDEFLKKKSTPEELMRAAQAHETSFDLQLAVQMLELARTRLEAATRNLSVGAGTQLDVKRAELDVLERTTEIKQIQEQLRKLRQ